MFEIKARFRHISLISFKSTHSGVNYVNRIGGDIPCKLSQMV